MTDRIFGTLGRIVVRYRWLVLAAWLAGTVIASISLPSLSSEVNNDNSQFLPASAPSSQAAQLAAPLLGSSSGGSQLFVVAARKTQPLDAKDLAAVSKVASGAVSVPTVEKVRNLGTSTNGRAARLLVLSSASPTNVSQDKRLVTNVEAVITKAGAPADLQVHLAGRIATNVANQASSKKTGSKTQLLSFVVIIILLLLIFRSVLAPLATLVPAGIALLLSTRLIGALGANGLKISEITDLLLIVLMLGAGTDYGLFLVFRVREEIRAGLEPREAVVRGVTRVGESITASAGTVIFALLSLLLASFGIYHDLGVPLAIGVAVMLLAGLTLLPAILAILGRGLFWPTKVVPIAGGERQNWWGRIASRLVARPAVTLTTGVVIFGALAVAVVGYHSAGFGGALNAPAGSDAAQGNAILAADFPSTNANPANLVLHYPGSVWRQPSELLSAERSLESSGLFRSLDGPLNPNGPALSPAELSSLHSVLGDPAKIQSPTPPAGVSPIAYNSYRAETQFISANGRTVQFEATLHAGGQESTAAMDATPQVRAAVARAGSSSGATANGVAGEAAALYDVSSTSNADLAHIVPVAIIAIGILLALVLRSGVAPLYLILSVALSYFASLGVSTLVFIDLSGESGLTFILPFLMFIFLLALGEDYNILVMTRIREEAHRLPLRDAVIQAVGRTGGTVTSAGLVLAATFGVLAIASGSGPTASQIQAIGFGLAIGILMDTFLVRTLLVPATVSLLGRWNWWPASVGTNPPTPLEDLLPATPPVEEAPAGR